ncbi:hypothetical protein ACN4EG_08975 [Alkalinema pantanalense CENA528]|uniref:hypothetical protein n=1 Tax=Alkalinema pantanalense TaxID=1620705 RepID=UPI003D6E3872
MQQATFANSTNSSLAAVLNPRIQTALSNLDSRLEDELARYRRYRAGLKVAPSSAKAMHPKPKLDRVELASFAPIGAPSGYASVQSGNDASRSHLDGADQTSVSVGLTNGSLDPQDEVATDSALAVLPTQADTLVSIEALTADTISDNAISYNPYELSMDFTAAQSNHAPTGYLPSDYLESSEALLRSLAEEEAQADLERGVLENLLTPLGVGSMLLMLLASGMFGYLVMNPNSLKAIAGLAGRAIAGLRAPSNSQTVVQAPVTVATEEPNNGFALDSQEFADLSLGNLTALRTGSSGVPMGKPLMMDKNKAGKPVPNGVVINPKLSAGKAVVVPGTPIGGIPSSAAGNAQPSGIAPVFGRSGNSGGPVRTTPLPQPRRFSAPAPVYRAPAPRYSPSRPSSINSGNTTPLPPAPLPPAPLPSVAPAPVNSSESPKSSGYNVVVPYDSDRTLEKVQQLDPNSYFRNSEAGAVIQTGGSYNSEAEAQQKVQELKQQGIEAEVQK